MAIEVKGLKLTNGMDIIAKNIQVVDGKYCMEKAVAITVTQGEGGPNMGFLPLTFFAADAKEGMSIDLDERHVLFPYTPNADISRGYLEFSSGLAVPKKPTIIT
jgi:hypothetical protein